MLLTLPAWVQAEKISLIFVSGIAEIRPGKNDTRGGLAELSTLLTELRESEANLLFFHGGAALAPSVLSTIDKGAHMIGLLNLLEPDLMAVAKSEFTHKEDELTLRTFEAAFPLVSTNTLDPLTGQGIEGIYPYQLIRRGSYTLGVMALVDT